MSAPLDVAVIGGGPAGLYAAERLATAGLSVTIFEKMPSLGRKFLMAGLSGLNLTHSEPLDRFAGRYHDAAPWLMPMLAAFSPDQLKAWAEALRQETFIGTSGRVFPRAMKASPLLRAWLARLDALGVMRKLRHEWHGFSSDGGLLFLSQEGETVIKPRATLFALGGASWPRLGSDGGWAAQFLKAGIDLEPFASSNCGLRVNWSSRMPLASFGQPLKAIRLSCGDMESRGEAVITRNGLEGGAVYALSPALRQAFGAGSPIQILCDLKPDVSIIELTGRLEAVRASDSLANRLRKATGLSGASLALLFEMRARQAEPAISASALASLIKALPVVAEGMSSMERAISTSGGIKLDELGDGLMFKRLPGVFVAGEMLAWDAPTGGYLLQACFSTANCAADGIIARLT